MNPAILGMLYAVGAGFTFSLLNIMLRMLSEQLPPFEVQFLRYFMGLVVMTPWILHEGLAAYRTRSISGQLWRGAVHASGLYLWFAALPIIPFSELVAISFTGPIFIMIGAVIWLKEVMFWQRWVAGLIGFVGVLVVVWPGLTGGGNWGSLLMLASSPLFAASFLITKALAKRDSPTVIVAWQSLTVTLFTLPAALYVWQWPSASQWAVLLLCGALGSFGHWLLTNAYRVADISTAQPVKFLDMIWAATLGYLVLSEIPTSSTLVGAAVIFISTTWIARVEARRGRSRPA
ncbi:DMT family transporter [Roseococcus pinisoli]|uniref:DMT family transporter n=1 Tax=Roseococcus pinisoli TaxID=2835040 RepID=A0ABS5QGJ8_9PROT|nr:DMT family transporter [uncultured Roseococcus sp.]MBS7812724.1 DMT family transporter [Roseococcus pinisoli]